LDAVRDRFNNDLRFLGVLPNKVHPTSRSQKQFMSDLFEELGENVIPQALCSRVAVSDAIDSGRPVWDVSSRGGKKAGAEFKSALKIIEKRMNEN
jgi:chromosome partitioning protein